MNDSSVAGYRDKDMVVTDPAAPSLVSRVRSAGKDAVQSLESYKLLRYGAQLLTFRPRSVGEFIAQQVETKKSGTADYESLEPWTRVSPRDYESNIREMIRLAGSVGAKAVLVDNELWDGSPYRPVLRRISSELQVPLVDSLSLIAAARERMTRELESQLNVSPGLQQAVLPEARAAHGRTTVVFRVYRGTTPVPRALSIVGVEPQLGGNVPNAVQLYDDGTHGDERAGDGVWSLAVGLPSGKPVFYVYTNSGARGRWEGLDLPHIRRVDVPDGDAAGAAVYLPIETFGRVYMQGDDWHTDKVGYDLIGRAVAHEIAALR